MDIKSRSIKYSSGLKAVAIFFIWISLMIIVASSAFFLYYFDIKEMVADTPYEVYAAIMEPLQPGDEFYDGFTTYTKIINLKTYVLISLIVFLVILIIAVVYIFSVVGRKECGGKIYLTLIDKVYIDLHALLVFFAALFSIGLVNGIMYGSQIQLEIILCAIVFSIDVLIGINFVLAVLRQIKNKQILKNTLIFRISKLVNSFLRMCFNGKLFKAWTLIVLLFYGLVNGILFYIFFESHNSTMLLAFILLVAFNFAALYFLAKTLLSLTQIMTAAKEVSKGNLDFKLDASKISVAFSGFAESVQNIQEGIINAVDRAVKGEHMKTTLITNVSHDLKTPLTSIITYLDLLKKEEINNENAVEYIDILDEKSLRLKQLIEDLIEASKASTGDLVVKKERLDFYELIMQATGEYEEKIKQAKLDIRFGINSEYILITADGRHMWRIIENLLANAVKYSHPNTRVYIYIGKSNGYGELVIKNISNFPLDISPDQLIERFVRGEASRTTEGSGLGLSIAQGLTLVQGGKFDIEIDGDLFKVIVKIPLCED
ncbi:MAG: sensor histidine kinase [Vulcanibacillus sp.]